MFCVTSLFRLELMRIHLDHGILLNQNICRIVHRSTHFLSSWIGSRFPQQPNSISVHLLVCTVQHELISKLHIANTAQMFWKDCYALLFGDDDKKKGVHIFSRKQTFSSKFFLIDCCLNMWIWDTWMWRSNCNFKDLHDLGTQPYYFFILKL